MDSGIGLRTAFSVAAALLAAVTAGCRSAPPAAAEPEVFRDVEYDAVWDATRAVLAEHFPIYTARRESGDILTEFVITYGLFEFWRDQSTNAQDLTEDTVQSIRRRARAEVTRAPDGAVRLDLAVEKERRDRAQRARLRFSFGSSASIFDPEVNALDRDLRDPTAPDWAPLGRDAAFESHLLAAIRRGIARPQ